MQFCFLRHGHYVQGDGIPSALLPHPLTPKGIQQSEQGVTELIKTIHQSEFSIPDCIITSSLLRAFQTAKIFQLALEKTFNVKIPLIETDMLWERSMGSLSNLSVEEIERIIALDPRHPSPPNNWKSSFDYALPYPYAESLSDAGKRVQNCIIQNTAQFNSPLFVGHGASFRHAAYFLGILSKEEIAKFSMYHAHPLIFNRNGSNQLVKQSGDWKIRERKEQHD